MKKNYLSLLLILSPAGLSNAVAAPLPYISRPAASFATQEVQQALYPKDFNVFTFSDDRILITMAALNLAGYDYESDGKFSALRAQMREDLKTTDPALVAKMQSFYRSHRSSAREEIAQVSPYIGLALCLGNAPAFETPPLVEKLPLDVRDVIDFVPLLREFYGRSAIKELLPKYKTSLENLRLEYERAAGVVLYETISYLHTQPILFLPPAPIFSPDEEMSTDKQKQKEEENREKKAAQLTQPRMRRLLIFLNPFAPAGSIIQRNDVLNGTDTSVQRRLGDDYFIVASEQSLREYVRYGFLRFVLDPIVGKRTVEIANLREKIASLLENLPQAKEKAKRNVYEVVGDSLARAASLRIIAVANRSSFTEDEAAYLLSQYYEQGAVLVFHFYNGLQGLERVGIDVKEFVEPYLNNIDFAREAKRLEETKEARLRFEKKRLEQRQAVKSIVDLDDLIKRRQYDQARQTIEQMLQQQPNNARALFALAQINNNQPSKVELDEDSTEEEKISAQEERLSRSVKLYREAIAAVTVEEQWIASQCHVLIGRILDFVEQRQAAISEYEKAIKIGDIPKGAYKEALEGKQRPYTPSGQKQ